MFCGTQGRVRATLDTFRKTVIERQVRGIEQLVLESYRQLLHKASLVTRLAIDPESFALTLYGRDGLALGDERLSAGERQLLAIALLWGLAKASGRPLPTAIDTPLGRLDAGHSPASCGVLFPLRQPPGYCCFRRMRKSPEPIWTSCNPLSGAVTAWPYDDAAGLQKSWKDISRNRRQRDGNREHQGLPTGKGSTHQAEARNGNQKLETCCAVGASACRFPNKAFRLRPESRPTVTLK